MKNLFALCLIGLAGCGTYSHQRPVVLSVVIGSSQTNIVVASETTSIRVFFQKLDTTALNTSVTDGDYRRKVSLGRMGTTGDAESISALGDAIADGMVKYQTMGLKAPTNLPSLGGQP